jgi:phage tail sheath protein FI
LEVNYDTSHAALYYPWIKIADLSSPTGGSKFVPPSGHVVGIYNRTDGERGVHKAPANEVVLGATDLELNITKGEQGVLNKLGINCIRSFPGRGIRVWGARTLSSDGSWRYINVRRLFNQVGSSLDTGLQWVVFEPNDHNLWAKVRRDINAFLRVIWRSGALFGVAPEDAFYVKCDEELNPHEIRDLGQLIIEVGMAPVKPAEFVILRLSQWAGANSEG